MMTLTADLEKTEEDRAAPPHAEEPAKAPEKIGAFADAGLDDSLDPRPVTEEILIAYSLKGHRRCRGHGVVDTVRGKKVCRCVHESLRRHNLHLYSDPQTRQLMMMPLEGVATAAPAVTSSKRDDRDRRSRLIKESTNLLEGIQRVQANMQPRVAAEIDELRALNEIDGALARNLKMLNNAAADQGRKRQLVLDDIERLEKQLQARRAELKTLDDADAQRPDDEQSLVEARATNQEKRRKVMAVITRKLGNRARSVKGDVKKYNKKLRAIERIESIYQITEHDDERKALVLVEENFLDRVLDEVVNTAVPKRPWCGRVGAEVSGVPCPECGDKDGHLDGR